MCQLSNKQPPSITSFILNSKNFVSISSNKHFLLMLCERFGNAPHRFALTTQRFGFISFLFKIYTEVKKFLQIKV